MFKKIIPIFILFSFFATVTNAAPQAAKKEFSSVKICGRCHRDIFASWKKSMHAASVTDPIFHPIFQETLRVKGKKAAELCLSCHAPTTRISKDVDLKNPITSEGVGCDFCHSVKGINLSSSDPFELEPTKKKWGPLQKSSTPAHETGYAEVFEQARFCGTCHDYVNERGVTVLGTYSEWKNSPQAKEGVTCQNCHMPKIEGRIVSSGGNPSQGNFIHSHAAAGGHSASMIKKAVSLKIEKVERAGDKIHAVVQLENVGSGHLVPTGLPTRKLVLKFQATTGGSSLYSTERVFQKVILNKKGEVITRDIDAFLDTYKVKEDNRLEPRKMRSEHFSFLAPKGKPVEVETSVFYVYQPGLAKEIEMKVELDKKKSGLSAR